MTDREPSRRRGRRTNDAEKVPTDPNVTPSKEDDLLGGNWFTISEAAGLIGKSVDTIRRRIKDGTYDGQKVSSPNGPQYLVWVGPEHIMRRNLLTVQSGGSESDPGVTLNVLRSVLASQSRVIDLLEQKRVNDQRIIAALTNIDTRLSAIEARLGLDQTATDRLRAIESRLPDTDQKSK